MRILIRSSFLVLAILCTPLGCTTASKAPFITLIAMPPQYTEFETLQGNELEAWLRTKSKEKLNENERMVVAYRLGNCDDLKQARESLSKTSIPQEIKNLFHIKWVHRCPESPLPEDGESVAAIEKFTREAGPLKELALKALLQRAIARNEIRAQVELRLALAPIVPSSSEQAEHLAKVFEFIPKMTEAVPADMARKKLELLAPRFIVAPMPEQWLAVAESFKRVRNFDQAIRWYTNATKSQELGWPERIRGFEGLRVTKRLMGQRDEALEFAEKVFELNQKYQTPDLATKSGSVYARALWTQHRRDDAKKVIALLMRKYRKSKFYPEVLQTAAQIDEEEKNIKLALERLTEVVKVVGSDSALLSKALWTKGWIEFKNSDYKAASVTFKDLSLADAMNSGQFRAKFWLARAYEKLGQTKESQQEYEEIINSDPAGYYGLLSHRQLNRSFKPIMRSQAAPSKQNDSLLNTSDELTRIALWFTAVNETQAGRSWLGTKAHRMTARQYAHLLGRLGSYAMIFSIFASGDVGFRQDIIENEPELIFPRLWPNIVGQASQKFQVPPELIYAIMRQESSFDPKARSHADAFGLMQILPSIAKETADHYSLTYGEYQDLEKEAINIPIGVALLRRLLTQYSESFILAVASYNANEKAIKSWLRDRYQADPTLFIEEIPYEETRNYVKLVMRNFIFYQRLESNSQAATFPDWCLKPLQASNN